MTRASRLAAPVLGLLPWAAAWAFQPCALKGPAQARVGEAVAFAVQCRDSAFLDYSFEFADGHRRPASWESRAGHTYLSPGHYGVVARVTDGSATAVLNLPVTVTYPVTSGRPAGSATLAYDSARARIWN